MKFFKKRAFLPFAAIGIASAMFFYGVFIQPVFTHNDYIEDYNSGVRHLSLYLESGGEEELGSAKESFKKALAGSPSPQVSAAILYNDTIPTLKDTDWKGPESRSILAGVIAELQGAGRYDPTDKDIKINLSKVIALKELSEKYLRKDKGDRVVPLPPNLQNSRKEEEIDTDKAEFTDLPAKESGSKTPPPDF